MSRLADRLQEYSRTRLGGRLGVATAVVEQEAVSGLLEAEAALTAAMGNLRKAEFAAGRLAAHAAMVAAGGEPLPVGVGDAREPLWPEGFTGSISHSDGLAISAIAPVCSVRAIGIDVCRAGAVVPELWGSIATRREREWIVSHRAPLVAASMLFAAKEAAYKLQFPLTRQFVEFREAEVAFLGADCFRVTCEVPAARDALDGIEGHVWISDELILAMAVMPA